MIDLQLFCDPDFGNRYGLHLPFARSGKLYASDGRIAVCVPAEAGQADTTPEERYGKRLPKIDELPQFRCTGDVTHWQPWPESSPIINPDYESHGHNAYLGECPHCFCGVVGGTGCNECEAEGELYTRNGESRTCRVCNGIGHLGGSQCPQCKGDYKGPWPTIQQVGSLFVTVKYDAKIRTLPNVRWAEYQGSIIFAFDGGRGCIMPIDVKSPIPARAT